MEVRRVITDCTNTKLSPSTADMTTPTSPSVWEREARLKESLMQGWRERRRELETVPRLHFSVSMVLTRPALTWSPLCWTNMMVVVVWDSARLELCLPRHSSSAVLTILLTN